MTGLTGASSTRLGLHRARGARHHDRFERGRLRARSVIDARRGKAPAAVDQRPDANAVRLAVADAGDLPLTRRDLLSPVAADADVGVRRSRTARGVERFVGELDDRGVR